MVLDDRLSKLAAGVPARKAAHAFVLGMSKPAQAPAERSEADEFRALVEAMFLMAAVDGYVTDEELFQLRISITNLVAPEPVERGLEALIGDCAANLSADGWQARVAAVAARLTTPESRALAFRLAAGVALVDDEVESAEAAAIEALAAALGIAPEASQAILREVLTELFGD